MTNVANVKVVEEFLKNHPEYCCGIPMPEHHHGVILHIKKTDWDISNKEILLKHNMNFIITRDVNALYK